MQKSFKEFSTEAVFYISDQTTLQQFVTRKPVSLYTFIWTQTKSLNVIIDGVPVLVKPNSILTLTPIQYLEYVSGGKDVIIYQFNREFYCIKDHDEQVSCAGILFFGNTHIPIIELDNMELEKFKMLHHVFVDEINTKDTIQAEMLRMLLARFIIKCTRLLKSINEDQQKQKSTKIDLLRKYNILVEEHFRAQHSVAFYAEKLFKSPKTLSNNFAKLNQSPLKIIHERIILEAKRLLIYTDKTAKEIAHEIGFDDASHLSRLFKKYTSQSPSDFKKQLKQMV